MILHITNNFDGSLVHRELVYSIGESLEKKAQIVFTSTYQPSKYDHLSDAKGERFYYIRKRLIKGLRFFPFIKLTLVFIQLILSLKGLRKKVSVIIAHNLWSDGVVAYFYKLFTGTPYTVAIRNTDLNVILKRLPHYRWLIRRVLFNAEVVVFISPAYKQKLQVKYPQIYRSINSFKIIPNGVNDYWSNNKMTYNKHRNLEVIYVGRIDDNKNLRNSFLALNNLRNSGVPLTYRVIGGSDKELLKFIGVSTLPEWVVAEGVLKDRDLIKEYLRNARVFLMPSFTETFGLVYIEALSQGCCVVHSKEEGIDGFFNENYIRKVDPASITEIEESVKELLFSFPQGVAPKNLMVSISGFTWEKASASYLDILHKHLRS